MRFRHGQGVYAPCTDEAVIWELKKGPGRLKRKAEFSIVIPKDEPASPDRLMERMTVSPGPPPSPDSEGAMSSINEFTDLRNLDPRPPYSECDGLAKLGTICGDAKHASQMRRNLRGFESCDSRTHLLDFRMCELNRRLLAMNKWCDLAQWQAFTDDFFEPNGFFSFSFCLEDGVTRARIGRALIPRFFMTYFESVIEPQFNLNQLKLISVNNHAHSAVFDCPCGNLSTLMPLGHPSASGTPGEPPNREFVAMVRMDGRFLVEIGMLSQRFKSISFVVHTHREHVPRHVARHSGPMTSLTRGGFPTPVVNFLRMCNTLGPMQELMMRQKQTNLSPQETLRTAVFDRFQQISNQAQRPPNGRPSPPVLDVKPAIDRITEAEFQKPVVKQRRRRKQAENSATVPAKKVNRKGVQQPPAYDAYHAGRSHPMDDPGMMMVGSPVIMGSTIKIEEERMICKLENSPIYPEEAFATEFNPRGCSPPIQRF
ncbi:LIM domain-binding protein 2 [Galendromus occidentalis]|uniref:LIM domain-binding protein 2 n=1 Tax=Galendromus occidentalis TaxID=34638 RepID=A0AAJ7PAC7_9ACAR|nr:LIM domain-binding protein 2 [Galendromus occidentalis]